jgi:hypothetical protein
MGSQEGLAPLLDVAKTEPSILSDEPAAKRVKLNPDVLAPVEPAIKEPRVKVNGYALIKEE